jgi:hypothetical protein
VFELKFENFRVESLFVDGFLEPSLKRGTDLLFAHAVIVFNTQFGGGEVQGFLSGYDRGGWLLPPLVHHAAEVRGGLFISVVKTIAA